MIDHFKGSRDFPRLRIGRFMKMLNHAKFVSA